MRKRISKPIEDPVFFPDHEIEMSEDGLTASVVLAVPKTLPPTRTFNVDNLLRNGVSLEPSSVLFHASIEDNMDTIDKISQIIDDNELV